MVDKAFYDTHSDTTSEWYTPLDIYTRLDNEFHFVTDAATELTNRLRCKIFLTERENGLDISKWQGPVFINPPYSNKKYPVYQWVKAADQYRNRTGNPVVMVLRSTTEVECRKSSKVLFEWKFGCILVVAS
jgi:phage N-6-adenine-methyltransferase